MLLIGLMSGTSADGIDAALVEIEERNARIDWKLRAFICVPWQLELRAAILDGCRSDAPVSFVSRLNYRLGEEFARAAEAVADAGAVSLNGVDAIASHGQTIWHQPNPVVIAGIPTAATLQIGEPSVIAARTGCLVVADFRCADMALGGQGAPLVPFADYHLFSSPNTTRAVQNLGGIANVTLLRAGGAPSDILAFDTGPGNMLIDALTARYTMGRLAFDRDSQMAMRGHVNSVLLADCLAHPYFSSPPPKSTGREMFGGEYAEWFAHRSASTGLTAEDAVATATALTAESVANAYRTWLLPRGPIDEVILGGGGTHNRGLVQMLTESLAPARLSTHADFGVPDDAKEALAFALLGYSTLRGKPSNVPSATGASGPAVLGKVVLPPSGDVRSVCAYMNPGRTVAR